MKKFLIVSFMSICSVSCLNAETLRGTTSYGSIDCEADLSSFSSSCCMPLQYQCKRQGGKIRGDCQARLRNGSSAYHCNIDCEQECKGIDGSNIILSNQTNSEISINPNGLNVAPNIKIIK